MNTISKIWTGVLLIALAISLNSCYYDQVLPAPPPDFSDAPVLFSANIQPIFNASCNSSGCHSGAVAPNLLAANSYNNLKNGNYLNTTAPESSALYQWMTGKKSLPMPPGGPNAENNAKVLAWIKQGALNN
jgi:hypothetical protein